jgi:8-oxo-dGTP pyrophosphatase MutT (NUDIX family)
MAEVKNDRIIDVAVAVISKDDSVLVARRSPGQHLEKKWEFPGGKIEPGDYSLTVRDRIDWVKIQNFDTISKIKKDTAREKRLIIALPRQIDALRGVVEEVACLRWVESNTEELRDDRIARRELSLRLAQGEQRIGQLLQTLLDPRPAPVGNSCQWFWKGEEEFPHKPMGVTKLLSRACEDIYASSPRVRNELVVRRKLSSAASSARRCVMERMLYNSDEERLGINVPSRKKCL